MVNSKLTVIEAGRILGKHPNTVRRMIERKDLDAEQDRPGGQWFIMMNGALTEGQPGEESFDPSVNGGQSSGEADTPAVLRERLQGQDQIIRQLREQVASQNEQVGELIANNRYISERALPAPQRSWWKFWNRRD